MVRSDQELAALRETFGAFATGVVVVTVQCEGETHGMTASSFTSLSLEPPLVLLSIAKATRMAPLLLRARCYGISILAEHQADIATHFAGHGSGAAIDFDAGSGGVRLIGGAIAHLVCDLRQAHDVSDHTLFIGQVWRHVRRPGRPLVHAAGRYCAISWRSMPREPVAPSRTAAPVSERLPPMP